MSDKAPGRKGSGGGRAGRVRGIRSGRDQGDPGCRGEAVGDPRGCQGGPEDAEGRRGQGRRGPIPGDGEAWEGSLQGRRVPDRRRG